jgi:hypothetical protein
MKKLCVVALVFVFAVLLFAFTATAAEKQKYLYFVSYIGENNGRIGNAAITSEKLMKDYETIREVEETIIKKVGYNLIIMNFQLLE